MILRNFSTLFFLFCLMFGLTLRAQETILQGRIVDSASGLPLKDAEVYLSGTGIGAATDSHGLFQLTIKRSLPQDTLVINYLGYQTKRISLQEFKNKSVIYLTPRSLPGEEVVISAERSDLINQDIPHARNTIQYKEIELTGSSEITDILKPIPAVRIEGNDLDGRRIQIRGSNADEVNVYLDGILINNIRFDNAADLTIIPVEDIESIEILKGGNLSLVGNGAFGGVVNITTRQNTEKSFMLKGKLGDFDSRHLIAGLNLPLSEQVVVDYFGQISQLSPEIEYFPGEQYSSKTKNDAITTSKQNHNVGFNYYSKSGHFNGRFIGYYFNYKKPRWESNYKNYLSAASYRGEILGVKDFDVQLNHFYSSDRILRNPAGSTHYISAFRSNRFTWRLAKKFVYRGSDIQLLHEYYHDDLVVDSKVRDIEQENKLYHAFLYDNRMSFAGVVTFNDHLKDLPLLSWKTFLGIRGDFLANGNHNVTHTVGAEVNYNMEQWKFAPYFNYGKNVKYPTLQENAYVRDLTDFSRTDTTANRLEPEYSNAAELGVNFKYYPRATYYKNIDFSLALFTRTIFNKLLTRPFDEMIANIQIGRNVTRGVEASFKVNEIFNRISLTASFVQLDITNSLLYAYKPKKNTSLHLHYHSTFGLYLTSTFFYEGKSYAWYYDRENNLQTAGISPFYDMDFSVGLKVPIQGLEMNFQASGYNVFDSSGFKYYYLKKRYLQLSLAITY